jgi:AhpD family alkylhydroperoxidase
MRLPDAARAAFYHKPFNGDSMSAWTHAAMRGESAWSVGERELMAAMTARWNACPFCIGTHGAIAARVLGRPQVLSTLEDFRQAELSTNLQAHVMRNEEHCPLIEKTGDKTTFSLRRPLGDFCDKVSVVTLLGHFCHTSSHFALYSVVSS